MDITGYNNLSHRGPNTSGSNIMARNGQQRPSSTYTLKKNKYSTSNFQTTQKQALSTVYYPKSSQRAMSAKQNANMQKFYPNKNSFASNKNLLLNNYTNVAGPKIPGFATSGSRTQNQSFFPKNKSSFAEENRPEVKQHRDSKIMFGAERVMPSMISLQDNVNRMNPRNDWVEGDKKILFNESTTIKTETNHLVKENKLMGSKILHAKNMMKRYERMI